MFAVILGERTMASLLGIGGMLLFSILHVRVKDVWRVLFQSFTAVEFFLYFLVKLFLIYIRCNHFLHDAHTHGDSKLCKINI